MTDDKVEHVTPLEAEARVAEIAAVVGDDEVAHSKEDALRRDVLRAIANGAPAPGLLAAIALRTDALDFARWCA